MALYNIWLVVWLPFFIFPEILGISNHPNWRSHIFQRGGPTTNQVNMSIWCYHLSKLGNSRWPISSQEISRKTLGWILMSSWKPLSLMIENDWKLLVKPWGFSLINHSNDSKGWFFHGKDGKKGSMALCFDDLPMTLMVIFLVIFNHFHECSMLIAVTRGEIPTSNRQSSILEWFPLIFHQLSKHNFGLKTPQTIEYHQ